jgi:SagB-type dehydrogenase family enzyme
MYTTGVKDIQKNRVKKWCPSGGNLGSVQAYFVNNNIDKLENATYFYHAFKNELQQVTKDNHGFSALVSRDEDESILGTVILTGSLERLTKKYQSLSFRLANLDAGVAFAQGQVVSNSLGLSLKKLVNYDTEKVAKMLGINDIGEIVTIMADLRKVDGNE